MVWMPSQHATLRRYCCGDMPLAISDDEPVAYAAAGERIAVTLLKGIAISNASTRKRRDPAVDERTVGLAIIRAYQHAARMPAGTLATSYVRPAFDAGRAMVFAERLRNQGNPLSRERVEGLAQFLGIAGHELVTVILPALSSAGVLEYGTDWEGNLQAVEEYVGVTGSLLAQTARVFEQFSPTPASRSAVISGHLAAQAPMTLRNHLDAVIATGIPEEPCKEGVRAAHAAGMLRTVDSPLREKIVYNEHVWATGTVQIAGFLRGLPSDERGAILGIVNDAARNPGIALPQLAASAPDAAVLQGARRVGLVDSVKVRSRSGNSQTYAFSPLLEQELAARHATDALHERKLVVAHILFGHDFGRQSTGRIDDPVVLLNALLRKGVVGPATAITNDYMLLESYGIMRVRPATGSRSYLEFVKEDVVKDARDLLRQGRTFAEAGGSPESTLEALWLPGSFVEPEADRPTAQEVGDAANELFDGIIQRMHDEAARATRDEHF